MIYIRNRKFLSEMEAEDNAISIGTGDDKLEVKPGEGPSD